MDHIMIDGALMVWILRLMGFEAKRISPDMTSAAKTLFHHCNEHKKRIYFWGTREEKLRKTIDHIKAAFPHIDITGSSSGYYPHEIEDQLVNEIIRTDSDFVFIGMGSPKQERIAMKLKAKGFKGVALTCGGFLHQTSKRLYYYPKFVDHLNIRWLYRIYDEPQLLWRYLIKYPMGITLFVGEVLGYKSKAFKKAESLLLNSKKH